MKQRQIIFGFLFPPRQDAAKTVHPSMGSLDSPTSGFKSSLMFNRLYFFTTRMNVSRIVEFFHQVLYLIRIITFIKTHTLLFPFCWLWPFDRNTFYRRFRHFAVMAICTVNCKANRNLGTFGLQTTFNTFFGSVRRVWAGFFLHQVGLLSSCHPSIAMTSQSLSAHHNLPMPYSTRSEKSWLLPISEIANAPCCLSISRFHLMRSTGNRSVIQKIYHLWFCDPVLSGGRRQSNAYSDVSVSMARFFPIICLKFYTDFLFFVFSSLNPFKGSIASDYIGNSGVIRISS